MSNEVPGTCPPSINDRDPSRLVSTRAGGTKVPNQEEWVADALDQLRATWARSRDLRVLRRALLGLLQALEDRT